MKNSKQNSSASGNKQATGSKSTSGGRCCSKNGEGRESEFQVQGIRNEAREKA